MAGLTACASAERAPAPPPPAPAPLPPEAPSDPALPPVAPELGWGTLATTREGRSVRWRTLGRGPRRVLWIGGIHGDEREGARATEELAAAFLAEAGLADEVTLVLVEDANPDGSALRRRGNARGIDLNRNFPAPSFRAARAHGPEPLCEPESRALAELVLGWRPHLVLVAHSWRGAEFVNYDGPARARAERFAATSHLALRASDSFSPTPGSFGSWAGVTLGIPVLTLEFLRGRDPLEAWERSRAAILETIRSADDETP